MDFLFLLTDGIEHEAHHLRREGGDCSEEMASVSEEALKGEPKVGKCVASVHQQNSYSPPWLVAGPPLALQPQ